jgi:hypothetical protein
MTEFPQITSQLIKSGQTAAHAGKRRNKQDASHSDALIARWAAWWPVWIPFVSAWMAWADQLSFAASAALQHPSARSAARMQARKKRPEPWRARRPEPASAPGWAPKPASERVPTPAARTLNLAREQAPVQELEQTPEQEADLPLARAPDLVWTPGTEPELAPESERAPESESA